MSVFVDGPTLGNFLAAVFESNDLAHSADRCGHIQKKWPRYGRDSNSDRICSHQRFRSTKWVNEYFSGCERKTDKSLKRSALGIVANHSNMGGISNGQR